MLGADFLRAQCEHISARPGDEGVELREVIRLTGNDPDDVSKGTGLRKTTMEEEPAADSWWKAPAAC